MQFEHFFRVWIRNASRRSKAFAGVAVVVVVGLLVWSFLPASTDSHTAPPATLEPTVPPTAPTAPTVSPAPTVPGTTTSPPVSSAAPATSTIAATVPPEPACPRTPAGSKSISDTEIRVAIGVLDLGGAASNPSFGFPTADAQEDGFKLVIDAVNKAGGAACRNIVPVFLRSNLGDPNAGKTTCLDAEAADAFALINGSRDSNACFFRAGIPVLLGLGGGRVDEITQYFPYIFSISSEDAIARNSVGAMRSMGLLDPGPGGERVGFVYKSCSESAIAHMTDWLAEAGLAGDQLVTYDLGCPAGFVAPADVQQSILNFKSANVDRLIVYGLVADFANYTRAAEAQDFRPKYLVPNFDGTVEASYGVLKPDPANTDGAIAFTASSIGEESSSVTPGPGTEACNAIYSAAGIAPVYDQPSGYGGSVCTLVWVLDAMLDHAPSLAPTDLVQGLQAATDIPYSYPAGPVANADPGTFAGGQSWRALQFHADCTCWKLIETEFQPPFPESEGDP